jgi:hypothetical protein
MSGMLIRSPGQGVSTFQGASSMVEGGLKNLATAHTVKYLVKRAIKKDGVLNVASAITRENLGKAKALAFGTTIGAGFTDGITGIALDTVSTIASATCGAMEALIECQEEEEAASKNEKES